MVIRELEKVMKLPNVKPGCVLTTTVSLVTRPVEAFVIKRRPYIVFSVKLPIRRV